MGSFDGARVCELVCAVILSQQSNIIKNTDMGLYTGNGLIIIKHPNGPKLDSYKKKLTNAIKRLGFKVTINTNLKRVNFLDITLNVVRRFKCGTFIKKENDTPIYIYTASNHPPSIIKQISKSISR